MIIKKVKHPYRDEKVSKSKESVNTTKTGKKLCFLISPPKRRSDESKEDSAKRFLEKMATEFQEAQDQS